MAIKKVKLPNNTTVDINDARVVSDAIAYIGAAEGSATYVDGGQVVDLGDYAKKASPALTGTPTAPTASSGTNTTQIATTAFVQTAVSGKQNTLVSGTNIKTVNNTSLLGSGNVAVQATLVSGTNIKTINNQSLLGSGNINIGDVYMAEVSYTVTEEGKDYQPFGPVFDYDYPAEYELTVDSGASSEISSAIAAGKEVLIKFVLKIRNSYGPYDYIMYYPLSECYTNDPGWYFVVYGENAASYGSSAILWSPNDDPGSGDVVTLLVFTTRFVTYNRFTDGGNNKQLIANASGFAANDHYDTLYVLPHSSITPASGWKVLATTDQIPDSLSDLTADSTHRLVTDTEKSTWNGKQDALVSGTNIKTINSTSLLGSGNISVGTYSKPSGGIPASDIASGVIPTNTSDLTNDSNFRSITISSSEPTSSQGSNGDIWIVI